MIAKENTSEYIDIINQKYRKDSRRLRRKGELKHKNRNKLLAKIAYYASGAFEKEVKCGDDDKIKKYIKEISRSTGKGSASTHVKKMCNRKIRRSNQIFKRGDYRKATEYWWQIN